MALDNRSDLYYVVFVFGCTEYGTKVETMTNYKIVALPAAHASWVSLRLFDSMTAALITGLELEALGVIKTWSVEPVKAK